MDKELFFSRVGEICYKALLSEVCATPKPGLVDRANNGAHRDMDIITFLKSAEAISPYFYAFAEYGYASANLTEKNTLKKGREIGLGAEKTMFNATSGINTHKGMIFSAGLICMAAGRSLARSMAITVENICDTVAKTVEGISTGDYSENMLKGKDVLTNGEKIYQKYGLTGPRGEAESGFLTVRRYGLPFFKSALEKNMTENEALVRTLLYIMSVVDDTNVINRGGKDACEYVKRMSATLYNGTLEEIREFDRVLIEKNLSPGGSADLLAVTVILHDLEKEFGKP